MKDTIFKKTTGMKAESIEDLTAEYRMGDSILREQLFKKILKSSGSWATILFVFKNCDSDVKKVMIANFKYVNGYFTRYNYVLLTMEEYNYICSLKGEINGKEMSELYEKDPFNGSQVPVL